jgi:hypothetical protein
LGLTSGVHATVTVALARTISSGARQHAAGCCFVLDCERVLVTGGAAGTSDGDARFANVVGVACS